METKAAVTALAALAQESRLAVFRLLVRAGDEITVVERHPARISIAQVNALVYQQQEDQALAEMLIEMAEYPEAGKYFMRRLI